MKSRGGGYNEMKFGFNLNCEEMADFDGSDRLKLLYPSVNEEETPLPRSWSSKDKYTFIGLSQNNLRVHYKGHGKTHKDAASVRATHSIPSSCGLYYFEVTIISKGRDGYMGIGLSVQGVSMNRLPGWDKYSYGYHGDDGHSFCSSGTGQPYGPTFTTGDVIGCGVNLIDNNVFYTKNGHNLGIAFSDLPSNLYPTVGLQTPGEIVDANFGQLPFVFDIGEMMQQLRARIKNAIYNYVVPDSCSQWQTSLQKMVSTYLVHHGYCATAEAFSNDTGQAFQEEIASIKNRQNILKLVSNGRVGEAIDITSKIYPGLLEQDRNLLFLLKCRQFIEMVGNAEEELNVGMKLNKESDKNKSTNSKEEASTAATTNCPCPSFSSTTAHFTSCGSGSSSSTSSAACTGNGIYQQQQHAPHSKRGSNVCPQPTSVIQSTKSLHVKHNRRQNDLVNAASITATNGSNGGLFHNGTSRPISDIGIPFKNGDCVVTVGDDEEDDEEGRDVEMIMDEGAGSKVNGDRTRASNGYANGNSSRDDSIEDMEIDPPVPHCAPLSFCNNSLHCGKDGEKKNGEVTKKEENEFPCPPRDTLVGDREESLSISPQMRDKVQGILDFGRDLFRLSTQLRRDMGKCDSNRKMLQDAFSLLAYSQPRTSPVGYQLEAAQRESICATLNSAILELNNLARRPPLEMAVAHAAELVTLMSYAGLGASAFASVEEMLFE